MPGDELDDTAREMAEQIAKAPAMTIKMAREVIRHQSIPPIRDVDARRADLPDVRHRRAHDFAEMRATRAEEREPRYTGS